MNIYASFFKGCRFKNTIEDGYSEVAPIVLKLDQNYKMQCLLLFTKLSTTFLPQHVNNLRRYASFKSRTSTAAGTL